MDGDAIAVRNDAHVVGRHHLIAGEQALGDFQIFQIPSKPGNRVKTAL
jgi:hypothetical protein